jgi:hypothetical protein
MGPNKSTAKKAWAFSNIFPSLMAPKFVTQQHGERFYTSVLDLQFNMLYLERLMLYFNCLVTPFIIL